MVSSSSSRSKVFISYSHQDARYLKQLKMHLDYYVRVGLIEVWDDTKLSPGAVWQEEIKNALRQTKVAILLVSAAFLASKFIVQNELPPLLAAAQSEGTVIIPVILSACAFEETELAQFQAVNSPSKPLLRMSKSDKETTWNLVAKTVLEVINSQPSVEEMSKQSGEKKLTHEEDIRKVVRKYKEVEVDAPRIGEEQSRQHEEEQGPTPEIAALRADISSQKAEEDAIKHGNLDLAELEVQREPTDVISPEGLSQEVVPRCPKAAGDEESQSGRSVKPTKLRKRRLLVALVILLVLLFSLLPFLLPSVYFATFSRSPQQPTKPLSPQNDGEVQDQNLAVQFIGTQQNTFVLPTNPLKLSPNQLPKQRIPALCIDQPKQQVPSIFRIAIRISNLRRDQYVLLIEQVQFIVVQITSIPHPLYALVQNPPALSNYNLYRGTYTGQDTNVPIRTTYDNPPYTYVFLTLHETDTISIQVTSLVEALLSFRIAITYRVANERLTRTLTLPHMFQVVFSDKSNWHPYQLRDGHFTQLDTP